MSMPSPDRAVTMRSATIRALTATVAIAMTVMAVPKSHDWRRADARPKQILSQCEDEDDDRTQAHISDRDFDKLKSDTPLLVAR
jgi:hypothetical protein